MEIIRFGTDDAANILQREPQRIDTLPYGAILLDRSGDIQRFNKVEATLSGLAEEKVLGRNFFSDIAPCSRNQPVYEHFKSFVSGQPVDAVIRYAIELPSRAYEVKVHIKTQGKMCWLFLKRA